MRAYSADSHTGHRRSHNEDCYKAAPEHGLWLVADGVGGHANGEIASAIVCDTLLADLAGGADLVDAIRHAHGQILEEIASGPANNMGSTVVALRLEGDAYEIAWVGDSRAYLFDGELRQLTRDHNPVSEMLARGAITAQQAAAHPERNMLSQSLGVSANVTVNPDCIRGELRPGQQLLLCSDGLTDEVPDPMIAEVMRRCNSPETQVRTLIQTALNAGGRDNVTVVVVGDKGPDSRSGARKADNTLEMASPVAVKTALPATHDRKVLLLLAAMLLLAVLWILW